MRASAFAHSVAAFARQRELIGEGARVLVALSGGPDSCALLLALCEAADAGLLPRPVAATHFHHGLRGVDADEDAAFSAALAARYGIPCVIGLGAVPRDGRSPNDAARQARYNFLLEAAHDFEADTIATAHTADDQAETVLNRVLRGTSVDGLAGIPARRALTDGITVVRPLLSCRRADIEAYCAAQGITPRHDPSNEKDRYARSRLRKRLPDLARDFNPRLTEALVRLSGQAATDADLLNTLTDNLMTRAMREERADLLTLDAVVLRESHPALRHRVLIRALRRIAGDLPVAEETATAERVGELEALLFADAIPNDLPGGIRARREGDLLRLERTVAASSMAPPDYSLSLTIPGSVHIPELLLRLTAECLPPGAEPVRARRGPIVDIAYPDDAPLLVRPARPGDRIAPFGMQGRTRLIRDQMADAKWPAERRERTPVVVRTETDEILWVPELAQAESTRITDATERSVRLTVIREFPEV
jgi:tRNA(Ile)-lysidine synthase